MATQKIDGRLTTEEAKSVNQTGSEAEMIARRKAIMAAVKPPTYVEGIPFANVRVIPGLNVRDDESVKPEHNGKLVQSLRERGLEHGNKPMTFNLVKRGDVAPADYDPANPAHHVAEIIAGHVRYNAMTYIREEVAAAKRANNEPIDGLPFETVHGLCYRGLTDDQKAILVGDHLGEKGLTEPEIATMIGRYIDKHGVSYKAAELIFGIDASNVQRHYYRWALPDVVMDNFRKEKNGDQNAVKIKQTELTFLWKHYRLDVSAGVPLHTEGPHFRKAWDDLLEMKRAGVAPKPTRPTADVVKQQAESLVALIPTDKETREAIQGVLNWANGEGSLAENAARLNARVETLLRENLRLNQENAALTEKVKQVEAERNTAIDAVTEARSERDAIAARLADSEREREGLAAELANAARKPAKAGK